ncbi:hypothetical protein [Sphingobium sp.]|uniref:hypothetical protein n=1 Tax=Sphingobium sp. TaxID=1912891 RepID=UPI002CE977DB|nr:hypothetical protein [Sphingobium sp.]HUD93693.1 hypothetical protein [Sphingobium sp.]
MHYRLDQPGWRSRFSEGYGSKQIYSSRLRGIQDAHDVVLVKLDDAKAGLVQDRAPELLGVAGYGSIGESTVLLSFPSSSSSSSSCGVAVSPLLSGDEAAHSGFLSSRGVGYARLQEDKCGLLQALRTTRRG